MVGQRRSRRRIVTFILLVFAQLHFYRVLRPWRRRTSDAEEPPPRIRLPFAGVSPCHDIDEAYGAAFLVSATFLTGRDIKGWRSAMDQPTFSVGRSVIYGNNTNMEGASFAAFRAAGTAPGLSWMPDVVRTVDAFEFMVEHLSIYERKLHLRRMAARGSNLRADVTEAVAGVMRAREASLPPPGGRPDRLDGGSRTDQTSGDANSTNGTRSADGDRVIAVMPFYGAGKGSGNSLPETRFAYLSTCFRSVSGTFRNVAVVVSNEADRAYAAERSGLPFFDVVLIDGLGSPSYLGVATVLETQRRFVAGDWSDRFDFAYFTESDQVLHLRRHQLGELLSVAESGDAILVPHRFLPLPHASDFGGDSRSDWALSELKRQDMEVGKFLAIMASKRVENLPDLSGHRCCFDRGSCQHRENWISFYDDGVGDHPDTASAVHLIRIGGERAAFAVINGPMNQFKMMVRTCAMQKGGGSCPTNFTT